MVTAGGVRINLIFNGAKITGQKNTLLDEPIKKPGITHPAFIINNFNGLSEWQHLNGLSMNQKLKDSGNDRWSQNNSQSTNSKSRTTIKQNQA